MRGGRGASACAESPRGAEHEGCGELYSDFRVDHLSRFGFQVLFYYLVDACVFACRTLGLEISRRGSLVAGRAGRVSFETRQTINDRDVEFESI